MALLCGAAQLCAVTASAQQLIGYVKADDADVTGATDVLDGQAVLAGSAGVTAKSHTAVVTLGRGGLARVCQTSALHMTQSKVTSSQSSSSIAASAAGGANADAASATTAPLLFSLEHGAVEIRMNGLANDSIMTPDLRMTVQASGPLDVRLRVARNGDTCVENHGAAAPILAVSDPFGTSMYELMAGQHVLFEHGDLHEVVDHETEPCGCPQEPGATVAEALLAPGGEKIGAKAPATPASVELQHPFPAAVSEGLAPATSASGAEANPEQPQATAAFRYNAAGADASGKSSANGASAQPAQAPSPPSAAQPVPSAPPLPIAQEPRQEKPPNRDLFHAIGHFFRKLFGD